MMYIAKVLALLVVAPIISAQDDGTYNAYAIFSNGLRVSPIEKFSCNDIAYGKFVEQVKALNQASWRALSHDEPSEPSAALGAETTSAEEQPHRDLTWSPRLCGSLAARVDPRCAGRGRRRKLTMKQGLRRKLQTPDCTQADVDTLRRNVDTVVTRMWNRREIVENCRNYLTRNRVIECRPAVSCDITAINLWNGDTDSMMEHNLPDSGYQICSNQSINFEAETEFSVGRAYLKLSGTGTTLPLSTEAHKPYFLQANDGARIPGTRYRTGTYTLDAYSDNSPNVKTITFEVISC